MERPLVFSALSANSRATVMIWSRGTPRDLFRPGRRVRLHIVVGLADIARRRSRGRRRNWRGTDRTPRPRRVSPSASCSVLAGTLRLQHVGVIGAREMIVLAVAEIGEADRRDAVLDVAQRQPEPRFLIAGRLLLQVPLALLAPAEADRALGHDDLAGGLVIGDRLPFRIVGLAQFRSRSRRRAGSARAHSDRPASPAAPASACPCTGAHSR